MANLDLWQSVEETDPNYAKAFSRSGFKGTATNPTYLARKATEQFGPAGIGWGMDVLDEQYRQGAPIQNQNGQVLCHEQIHIVYVRFWYVFNGQPGEVYQYGQTTFVGTNKYGTFTDEEAPKKSLTDAMVKAMSRLGFSADVHMGLWDDSKYVESLKNKFANVQNRRPFQASDANGGSSSSGEDIQQRLSRARAETRKLIAQLVGEDEADSVLASYEENCGDNIDKWGEAYRTVKQQLQDKEQTTNA